MKKLIPLILLTLPGCSALLQPNTVPCVHVLLNTPSQNAAEIIQAAQASPACRALALDILQQAVADAMAKRGMQ